MSNDSIEVPIPSHDDKWKTSVSAILHKDNIDNLYSTDSDKDKAISDAHLIWIGIRNFFLGFIHIVWLGIKYCSILLYNLGLFIFHWIQDYMAKKIKDAEKDTKSKNPK